MWISKLCRLDDFSADEVEMKGYFFSRIMDIGILEQITVLDFSMDSSYVTPITILTLDSGGSLSHKSLCLEICSVHQDSNYLEQQASPMKCLENLV
jgi:hypothetical protein